MTERMLPQTHARLHLAFLDGLRGLAAFYVLLFHILGDGKEALAAEGTALNLLRFGHEAVVLFIVLSGFVLALPVARSSDVNLSGGLLHFFRRRARRILPGYYAALFLLPLFLLAVDILKYSTGEGIDWERINSLFFSANMLSHLLLLHNLSPAWSISYNPVLWSLSTEWWIYVVFALCLVPLWKRFGIWVAGWGSVLLGVVPAGMVLWGWPMPVGSPHLLGAFGVGMVSAVLLSRGTLCLEHSRQRAALRFGTLVAISLFCAIVLGAPALRLHAHTRWIPDLLIAVACAGIILSMAATATTGQAGRRQPLSVIHILESRPLIWLGSFSYSLYLTHVVVWKIIGITLNLAPVRRWITISEISLPVRLFVVIPILLAVAYGFYLLFEKPFLSRQPAPRQRAVRQTNAATAPALEGKVNV